MKPSKPAKKKARPRIKVKAWATWNPAVGLYRVDLDERDALDWQMNTAPRTVLFPVMVCDTRHYKVVPISPKPRRKR